MPAEEESSLDSGTVATGTVVRTIPCAGTSLAKGSVVNILVNDRSRSNIT